MKLFSLISAAFAALCVLTPVVDAGVDAWHMDHSWTLVQEALDPNVSPNAIASHMHRVISRFLLPMISLFPHSPLPACSPGGSMFGASYN